MEIAVRFHPVINYVLCFSTLSKYLKKIKTKFSAREMGMEKEIRGVYEELANKMNIEDDKRKRIIEQFMRFFDN